MAAKPLDTPKELWKRADMLEAYLKLEEGIGTSEWGSFEDVMAKSNERVWGYLQRWIRDIPEVDAARQKAEVPPKPPEGDWGSGVGTEPRASASGL